MKSNARFVSAAILLAVTMLSATPAFAQGHTGSGRHSGTSSSTPATDSTLGQLPLALLLQQSSIVTYFNQLARSSDLAELPAYDTNLAGSTKNGKRMVFFASWAVAQAALPGLIGKIDTIGYDPEHWSDTQRPSKTISSRPSRPPRRWPTGMDFRSFWSPIDRSLRATVLS
jgi:hypothetical protein